MNYRLGRAKRGKFELRHFYQDLKRNTERGYYQGEKKNFYFSGKQRVGPNNI